MTTREAEAYLEKAALDLGEHFEAVEIFVSRTTPDIGTECIKRGVGNWYARQGMAHEFINCDRAEEQASEIARRMIPPDDGDNWKETV